MNQYFIDDRLMVRSRSIDDDQTIRDTVLMVDSFNAPTRTPHGRDT